MKTNILAAAAALSNAELLARLTVLAGGEREATVELIAHLAELDARRTYLAEGYGSLFSYCTGELRLSEYAAYHCIEAARAARRFPVILDLLAEGSLSPTTVRLLAPHLTPDNHREVLADAAGRSRRGIEALVALLAPRPDVAASIRKLPAPALPGGTSPEPAATASGPPPETPIAPAPPGARPVVAALAPQRYRVQFTVGRETHEKLRFAQDMLRREIPDGDPGAIFDRALTLLLDEVARTKMAATATPRPGGETAAGSRHVPAAVKRAVWFRDRGQCAFVSKNGRRCLERVFLELHHVQPFAVGGETTTSNVSLRCRGHNAYEAELVFGRYDPSLSRQNALGPGQVRSAPICATSSLASTS